MNTVLNIKNGTGYTKWYPTSNAIAVTYDNPPLNAEGDNLQTVLQSFVNNYCIRTGYQWKEIFEGESVVGNCDNNIVVFMNDKNMFTSFDGGKTYSLTKSPVQSFPYKIVCQFVDYNKYYIGGYIKDTRTIFVYTNQNSSIVTGKISVNDTFITAITIGGTIYFYTYNNNTQKYSLYYFENNISTVPSVLDFDLESQTDGIKVRKLIRSKFTNKIIATKEPTTVGGKTTTKIYYSVSDGGGGIYFSPSYIKQTVDANIDDVCDTPYGLIATERIDNGLKVYRITKNSVELYTQLSGVDIDSRTHIVYNNGVCLIITDAGNYNMIIDNKSVVNVERLDYVNFQTIKDIINTPYGIAVTASRQNRYTSVATTR